MKEMIEMMEKKIRDREHLLDLHANDALKVSVDPEEIVFRAIKLYLDDSEFAGTFLDCMRVLRRKNADYTQGEQKQDRIAAFLRIARDVGIHPTKVWAVFAQKHWGAIMRYVKDGLVESEPIEGRITDLINYLVLFREIVRWHEHSEAK